MHLTNQKQCQSFVSACCVETKQHFSNWTIFGWSAKLVQSFGTKYNIVVFLTNKTLKNLHFSMFYWIFRSEAVIVSVPTMFKCSNSKTSNQCWKSNNWLEIRLWTPTSYFLLNKASCLVFCCQYSFLVCSPSPCLCGSFPRCWWKPLATEQQQWKT